MSHEVSSAVKGSGSVYFLLIVVRDSIEPAGLYHRLYVGGEFEGVRGSLKRCNNPANIFFFVWV